MSQTERGTKIHNDWSEDHVQKIKILENEKERAICGAKNRRGEPCAKTPLDNGRCKLHGGKSTGPADQAGNTNAMKTGITAAKTQSKIYEEWYGMIPQQERDPLIRTNRLLMIQNFLLTKYAYEIKDNPTLEDLERLNNAVDQLSRSEMRIDTAMQKRLKKSGLTKEQLDAMSPQERMNFINNNLLEIMLEDDYEFKGMFQLASMSLKAEGDLAFKAEENKNEEYDDEDIDDSIEGVDDDDC